MTVYWASLTEEQWSTIIRALLRSGDEKEIALALDLQKLVLPVDNLESDTKGVDKYP